MRPRGAVYLFGVRILTSLDGDIFACVVVADNAMSALEQAFNLVPSRYDAVFYSGWGAQRLGPPGSILTGHATQEWTRRQAEAGCVMFDPTLVPSGEHDEGQ